MLRVDVHSGTDVAFAAVSGIQSTETIAQGEQFAAGVLELLKPRGDLRQAVTDEPGDVVTGGLPAVADGEHLADVGQREPRSLRLPDEADPGDGTVPVVAVAGGRPSGLGQQSDRLVEAQRLRADARGGGHLTDQHRGPFRLTFQHTGRRSVAVPAHEEQQMRRVTVQYFDGCPNWKVLDERLRDLAGEHDLAIDHRRVETPEEAERVGFRGSPTLLIDDVDPFATGDEPVGLACRVYLTDDGPQGSPTVEQLRAVLA